MYNNIAIALQFKFYIVSCVTQNGQLLLVYFPLFLPTEGAWFQACVGLAILNRK